MDEPTADIQTSMSQPIAVTRPVQIKDLGRHVISKPTGLIGAAIVLGMLVLAGIGPLVAPYNPERASPGNQMRPPDGEHLMGTDINGMDVFSRVIAAPRTDVSIAVLGTLGAVLLGVPLGAIAGYFRSPLTGLLLRVSDVVQSFPVFLLGMALVVAIGQDVRNVILVIALINAPIYVRLTRSQALVLRERQFVEAARSLGGSAAQVLARHIVPNAVGPALANVSVTIGFSILLTAGLSFVGAGVRIPTPEWGSMIAVGAENIYTGVWWTSLFPGLALATAVLGFALLGDAVTAARKALT